MPYVPYKFPMTGGHDRRVSPLIADKASFYSLINMRQSFTRGALESTPRFKVHRQFNQGTYNTSGGGNSTENTAAKVHFFKKNVYTELYLSDHSAFKCVGSTQTQFKGFKQITCPTGNSVYKGCLLTFDDTTSISITLGQTYDVEIDGVNTFKWRVNGGAYTTTVAIDLAAGNVIDTGARLYWLASTGFTATDAWSWRRTDDTDASSSVVNMPIVQVNNNYYYLGGNGRVYAFKYISNTEYYTITAGYQPLYARNINAFQDHLILLDCDPEVVTTYTLGSIANSDLNNPDCFIATDVNEADWTDLTRVATNLVSGIVDTLTSLCSLVIQNRLFVFTTAGVYYTDYAGLPIPFNYQFLFPFPVTTTQLGYCVVTPYGAFVAIDNGIFSFDGATLTPILADIAPNLISTGGTPYNIYGIFYDSTRFELVVQSQQYWIVYQLLYSTFYLRNVSFDGNYATGGTQSSLLHTYYSNNAICVPCMSRTVLIEDVAYSGTPVLDGTSGTVFAVPTVVTQMLGDYLSVVKDNAPVYVAFKSASGGAGYRTYTAQMAKIEWYTSDIGEISSLVTGSGEVLMNIYRQISIRVSYRSVAFAITFPATTTTTLPAPACTLRGIETEIYVPQANR